jgi:branched-subunit amino acid transport protein
MIDKSTLWIVILGLGAGTFGLRFVFLGLIGSRNIPEWVLRHLRYTAVAMLPAIAAPMVLFPAGGEVVLDTPRMAAAVVTLVTGYLSRNLMAAVLAGAGTLYGLLFLLG